MNAELREVVEEMRHEADACMPIGEPVSPHLLDRFTRRLESILAAAQDGERLDGAEAVMGFAAWLTCRDEATIFGSTHDCAPVVQRVKEFCEANNLGMARGDYHTRLVHPTDAARSANAEGVDRG
jgi:hypothetical protein